MRCWACDRAVSERADAAGYLTCPSCGLRFWPSGVAPRDAYDADYFAGYSGGDYLELEELRRHEARVRLRLLPAARPGADQLLEIGCAAGFFLDEARAHGWTVTGVEPSAEMAGVARSAFGLDVRVGFVEDIDLSDLTPQVACAWHTLEHIPDPFDLLVTLRRGLAHGGVLAVEVPNAGSVRARRLGDAWVPLEPSVHAGQWTPRSLTALLDRAGFSEVTTSTVPFITYIQRPGRRLPRRALLAVRQRRWIREPHPTAHELLRAVAVR